MLKMMLLNVSTDVIGFLQSILTTERVERYQLYKALKHYHLLDLLYHLVTLSPEKNPEEEKPVEAMFILEIPVKVENKVLHPHQQTCSTKILQKYPLEVISKLPPQELQRLAKLILDSLGYHDCRTRYALNRVLEVEFFPHVTNF